MSLAVIGLEALIIVLLILALVHGAPEANQSNLARISAQSTENAALRATNNAQPRVRPTSCLYTGREYRCAP